jgi:hypothetical protein
MQTDMMSTYLPQQFEAVKDNNETIYWTGKPAFIPFIITGVPFLIFGLLWGVFDFFFIVNITSEMLWFAIPFFAIHAFPFYGSILNMVRLWLVHGNTYYAITNKRLMLRSGFWGTDFKAVDYDKIADLEVNVNPIENMFGVGTIRAFSGNTTSKGSRIFDNFIGVQNPYDVFKKIKEVSVDIKTDWNYPNAMRPEENPGYNTKYKPIN